MTFEDQIRQVRKLIYQIDNVSTDIRKVCNTALMEIENGGDPVELTNGTKQQLLQVYAAKKTQLQNLVSQLP